MSKRALVLGSARRVVGQGPEGFGTMMIDFAADYESHACRRIGTAITSALMRTGIDLEPCDGSVTGSSGAEAEA